MWNKNFVHIIIYMNPSMHTHTHTHTHTLILITTDELCSKANEVISTSCSIHGEIKPLVVSVQASTTEAHWKIHTAISESVEQLKCRRYRRPGKFHH